MEQTGQSQTVDARLLVLGFGALALLFCAYALLYPKWEYKALKLMPEKRLERVDKEAFAYSTINLDGDDELGKLGVEGWELVSSSLEVETAYPNFGRSEYVTGLQPNIRPQALLLVFKRQRLPWR